MKSVTYLVSFAITAMIFSGCSTVATKKYNDPAEHTVEKGIKYYLPAGVVQVAATWDPNSGLWDFTATPLYVPDIYDGSYELKPEYNGLFDNTVGLQINPNPLTPLLQSVNVTSTDESLNGTLSPTAAAGILLSTATSTFITAAKASPLLAARGFQSTSAAVDYYNFLTQAMNYWTTNAPVNGSPADENDFYRLKEMTSELSHTPIPIGFNTNQAYIDYSKTLAQFVNLSWRFPTVNLCTNSASFSAFQSYLVTVITNDIDLATTNSKSRSVEAYHHTVYLVSPMVNGVVTYAQYDLLLTAGENLTKTSFPKESEVSTKSSSFDGILVRDPIPYILTITGHIWITRWGANKNLDQIDPVPPQSWGGTTGNQSQPQSPGQAQGQQSATQSPTQPNSQTGSQLPYLWAYNFPENYGVFTNNIQWGPKTYTAFQQTFYLPDASHTRLVKIPRRALVQDITALTLVNGMVVNRQETRPSAFYAWMSIPKDIVNAIIPTSGSGSGNGNGSGSSNGNSNGSGNNANTTGNSNSNTGGGSGNNGGNQYSGQSGQNNSATQSQYAPIQ